MSGSYAFENLPCLTEVSENTPADVLELWRSPKGSRIRPLFFTDLFYNDFGIVIPRGRVID